MQMKIYKHSIKIRNAVWKLVARFRGMADLYAVRLVCPRVRRRMAGLGFAAFMLLGVAPAFSAVAPPMRAKARTAVTASANEQSLQRTASRLWNRKWPMLSQQAITPGC